MSNNKIGEIVWRDISVENAQELSSFYESVVGWKAKPVSMGDYQDYNMQTASGEVIAGVCHAKGVNQNLPSQWMMYVEVADIEASVNAVKELGGRVLQGPNHYQDQDYYVIEDIAGAVMTIFG